MPTYEYKCASCGCRFERWQSIREDAIKVCPECGGETKRILFPVGIIFKGSGFYVTDNRKSGSDEASGTPSASTSSTSGSSADSGSNGDKGAKQEAKGETAKAGSG